MTENEPTVSLREFLEAKQQWQRELLEVKLQSQQAVNDAYRDASNKALELAVSSMKERLDHMNKFREEAVEDKKNLMPRGLSDERHEEDQKWRSGVDVKFSNLAGRTAAYAAVLIVVLTLIGFALRFVKFP